MKLMVGVPMVVLTLVQRCLDPRSLAYHIFHFTQQSIDIVLLYLLSELCVFHTSEGMALIHSARAQDHFIVHHILTPQK